MKRKKKTLHFHHLTPLRQAAGDGTSVRIWNDDTMAIEMRPAAELRPGMVQMRMVDTDGVPTAEGLVWMDVTRVSLQPNAYKHPPFPEEVRDVLREIKAIFNEVRPMSLDEWESSFRCDHNPGPEIALWLRLAALYAQLTSAGNPLGTTPERRMATFRILVFCSVTTQEHVLSLTDRKPLSRIEAQRIVDAYFVNVPMTST